MAIATGLGDLTRFATATQLMAYLARVPSEHSTGQSKVMGGITKMGGGHIRRLLIEAAWAFRYLARKSAYRRRQFKQTPEPIQGVTRRAQQRICARNCGYIQRDKVSTQACIVVARELTRQVI